MKLLCVLLLVAGSLIAAEQPVPLRSIIVDAAQKISSQLPDQNADKSNQPHYEKLEQNGIEKAIRIVSTLERPEVALIARVKKVGNQTTNYPQPLSALGAELEWDDWPLPLSVPRCRLTVLLGRNGKVVDRNWIPADWAEFLPRSKEGEWIYITAKTEVLELSEPRDRSPLLNLLVGLHVTSITALPIPPSVTKLEQLQQPLQALTPEVMQCPTLIGDKDMWFQLKTKSGQSAVFMLPAPKVEWGKGRDLQTLKCSGSAFVLREQADGDLPAGWSTHSSIELELAARLDPERPVWTIFGGKVTALSDLASLDQAFQSPVFSPVTNPPVSQAWLDQLWWVRSNTLTRQVGLSLKADGLWLKAFGWNTKENWFRRMGSAPDPSAKPVLCTCKVDGKDVMGIDSSVRKTPEGLFEIKADWVEWESKDLPDIRLDGYRASRNTLFWKRMPSIFYDPVKETFSRDGKEVKVEGEDNGRHPEIWLKLIATNPECSTPKWARYQLNPDRWSVPELISEVETKDRINANQ